MAGHERHYGFTLIELVAVIAILAIIAVVAVPRYVDLRTDAHRSTVAAVAGAFQGAVRIANVVCTARNYASQDNLPGFGSGNVDFNAFCYPSDTANSNSNNVNATRCMNVWNGILALRPTINTSTTGNPDYLAAGSGATCTYTYRRDASTTRRFTYNAQTGAIAVTNP
jgi:prepilin-type N-terminal cleavage/methylation domain-containing protein